MNRTMAKFETLLSPQRMLFRVMAAVFLAELVVMFVLVRYLHVQGSLTWSLLDSTALSLLLAPFLWWWLIRPLRSTAMRETMLAANIINTSVDAIITIDDRGRITSFNPAAEHLFGYGKKEAIGRNIKILMPPPEREQHDAYIERYLKTGEGKIIGVGREVLGQRKDGVTIPIYLSVSEGREGDRPIFTGIVRDLTERKRAEEVLRESEHRYHSLFENMLEGFARAQMIFENGHPRDFRYLEVNKAFEKLTGLKNVVGKRVSDVIPGITESSPELFEVLGRVARTGNPERFEIYLGAMEAWFEIAAYGPEKGCFIAVFDNITERKRAQESLTLFRTLLDRSNDAIEVLDPDTLRFLDCNQSACEALGYTREEFLTMSVFDVDTQVEELLAAGVNDEIEKSGSAMFESKHRRKDGSTFPVEVNIKQIQLARAYRLAVVRDITERKRMESERQAILEIIQGVTNSANLEALLKLIHESIQKVLYAENCFVALYEENTDMLRMEFFVDKYDSIPAPQKIGKSCAAHVFATGKSLLIDQEDFDRLVEAGKVELVGKPSPSWLGVPLNTPSKTIGVLVVQHYEDDKAYSERDVEFLSSVGNQIALAIERKRVEAKILSEQTFTESTINSLPGIFYLFDETGKFLRWNKNFEQITGYSAEEIATLSPLDLFVGEEKEFIARRIQEVFASGASDAEAHLVSKSGQRTPYYFTGVRIDSNDQPCLIGVGLDIAERKQAEEELKQSEEKYRTILERMEEGYAEVDLRGTYVFVNDSFCHITGRTRNELLGVNYKEIFDSKHQQLLYDTYHRVYLTGEPVTGFEYEVTRKNGEKRFVEESVILKRDAEGRPIGFTGIRRDCTERKQAEQAIRESEERYRDLVENSLELITTQDMDGQILSANRAAAKTLGYEGEDYAGKTNLRDILAPEVRDQLDEYLARIRRDGVASGLMLVQTRTGEKRIWEYYNTLRTEGVGTPIVRSMARDITERRRAEEALRESEERYRDLVENAQDIIYSHDLQGNYTSSNKASERITGYSQEEALKLNFATTIAPEYLDQTREMMSRKLAGEEVTAYQLELIAKDGHRIPVEVNTRLVVRDGIPVGVQGIARDISERKHAEEELRRLATAVEQTADSVVITDLDGIIQYVNPAFERITGYAKADVVNQNSRVLKSDKTRPSVYKELWDTITRGKVWSGRLTNRKKDGTLFEERVTISPIQNESGRIVNYVAVKQDVTHQTQLEEQLRQSQKMEAIGQLAGGVAHDFNNLLTAINGYSSLALQRMDESNPIIKGYLEEIKKAGDRAANLTRQLLAFGRKQILQPLPINLNDVVTDMNKMLKRLIGEDIVLTAKLDPALRKIKADPGQIEQVLVNVVVNARDAMPQGGSLTLETTNIDLDQQYAGRRVGVQPGSYVMLAVSDTGTGMDEEIKARIFDPFFTTKEKGKGTGLGLSTVYGIIKQSGGNIWVYSERNRGTTFKIYLPQTESATPQAENVPTEIAIPTGSETILLVEDEDVVRNLSRQILEQAGYTVLDTPRGQEAEQLCADSDRSIDLLLTDVVMPQMSGKEVADQVSARVPGLKVLFMSGYTDEAIVHHGVLDSNVQFIQKPFTPAALARKVREVLDSSGKFNR